MRLRLQKFSYRFAEQVLNSKLSLKQEIEEFNTSISARLFKGYWLEVICAFIN